MGIGPIRGITSLTFILSCLCSTFDMNVVNLCEKDNCLKIVFICCFLLYLRAYKWLTRYSSTDNICSDSGPNNLGRNFG